MARPATKTPDAWKSEIKSAAQRLFTQRGFQAVSIDMIMAEVGAAKGTFYRFFSSKDELLGALVEDWLEDYATQIRLSLQEEAPLPQKFARVSQTIARMVGRTSPLESFFTDTAGDGSAVRLASVAMVELLTPHLAAALKSADESGEIAIDDADFTARFITHGALGALNAGDGGPRERVDTNMAYLPGTIARVLGMAPEVFTSDKETQHGKQG